MRQWRGVMIVGPDPAVRHIFLVAASWVLVTFIVPFILSLVVALFGATEEIGPFNDQFEDLVDIGITIYASFLQGRALGSGDPWAGLGYRPVARLPLVASMALPLIACAILWDILLYHFNPAAFGQHFESVKTRVRTH